MKEQISPENIKGNIVNFEVALKMKEKKMREYVAQIRGVIDQLNELIGKLQKYKNEAEKLKDGKSMMLYEDDIFKLEGDVISGQGLINNIEDEIYKMWGNYKFNEVKREMEVNIKQGEIESERERKDDEFIKEVMREIEGIEKSFKNEVD